MDTTALVGLIGLLLVKEAGLPIPIPGDLLVLGAGVAAAGASAGAAVPAPVVLGGILAAGFVGGTIQRLFRDMHAGTQHITSAPPVIRNAGREQ